MDTTVITTFYLKTLAEWREWLKNNHQQEDAVWVIFYKSGAGMPTINYAEAVEEALCFGWIDSKAQAIDTSSRRQYFSKRKPKSAWSKSNKIRVEKLLAKGRMTEWGMKCIEIAKANGSWDKLNDIEELKIPEDLNAKLEEAPEAKAFFGKLSKSVKQNMLWWIASAKKDETRNSRIEEIVACARQLKKPKQF
jgi:uncharacterized protein YdeI (YjbR/CyaY-like superfamily)